MMFAGMLMAARRWRPKIVIANVFGMLRMLVSRILYDFGQFSVGQLAMMYEIEMIKTERIKILLFKGFSLKPSFIQKIYSL